MPPFDAHLIGVDPDYRIRLRSAARIHDGPFLELGLE
jgi:hypothetical protein